MNKSKTVLLALPVFLAGCGLYYGRGAGQVSGHYYLNPNKPISAIGKIAVVELENHTTHPEISADFTEALSRALAKKHLFGLEIIYRTDAVYNNLQLNQAGALNPERLAQIHKKLKTDAVLLGSITQYQPYPHMSIAVRVKLVDLRDGGLLWAVQQVWDSSDKALEARMKGFFKSQMRTGYEPMKWQLATVSPRHFRKFVAYEVAQTLP